MHTAEQLAAQIAERIKQSDLVIGTGPNGQRELHLSIAESAAITEALGNRQLFFFISDGKRVQVLDSGSLDARSAPIVAQLEVVTIAGKKMMFRGKATSILGKYKNRDISDQVSQICEHLQIPTYSQEHMTRINGLFEGVDVDPLNADTTFSQILELASSLAEGKMNNKLGQPIPQNVDLAIHIMSEAFITIEMVFPQIYLTDQPEDLRAPIPDQLTLLI